MPKTQTSSSHRSLTSRTISSMDKALSKLISSRVVCKRKSARLRRFSLAKTQKKRRSSPSSRSLLKLQLDSINQSARLVSRRTSQTLELEFIKVISNFSDTPVTRARKNQLQRNVIFIIPFGVPGSGKSTIWKNIKEKFDSMDATEWTCDSVSSDGIRH